MSWVGLKTLVRRECGVIARYWFVTLAPTTITNILYFTIFGEILGGRIGAVNGVGYTEYMAPGLIALAIIPNSFSHTAYGFLGARLFGFVEELLIAPLSSSVIMSGYVAGGIVRGMLAGAMSVVTALLFSGLTIQSVWLSATVMLLVALVSAVAGFITGVLARSFEQVNLIQGLILVPVAICGGVFTPVSALPDWAQTLSFANPVFHMVNAIRSGFVGVAWTHVAATIYGLGLFGVVLVLIALLLASRKSMLREEASFD